MATLIDLSGDEGPLFKLNVLAVDQQEFRCFFMSEKLKVWLDETLPSIEATWTTEITCKEQVVDLLDTYCAGDALNFGPQFHILRPIAQGVWELKTGDVRIFGWFARRDHFVGVVADSAFRVKFHDLYTGYVGEVARYRDALELDEPKSVLGEEPDAVLSNFG